MRLAALVPSIPSDLVISLEKCGIRTDTDLLFSPTLEIYRQLSVGSASLLDLEQLVARVAQLASASGISALDMLKFETEAHAKCANLRTGVIEVDKLLDGFGRCRVIEISGDRQSGKTALALNIILRHLAEYSQSRVAWLDTTGDFSIHRVMQILGPSKPESASPTLERLQISLVLNIEAAYDVLQELEPPTTSNSPGEMKFSCIVIDTITPLLRPLLNPVSAQGHAIMTGFMHQLRIFSQRHSCSVLVLNDSTSFKPGNQTNTNLSTARKPSLGPSFAFLSDATLWLAKIEDVNNNDQLYSVHTAEVLRSKNTPSKTWCKFNISDNRILDHAS